MPGYEPPGPCVKTRKAGSTSEPSGDTYAFGCAVVTSPANISASVSYS